MVWVVHAEIKPTPDDAAKHKFTGVVLRPQGVGPYTKSIKKAEDDIKAASEKVKQLAGTHSAATLLFQRIVSQSFPCAQTTVSPACVALPGIKE